MRYCTPNGAPDPLCASAREAAAPPISTDAAAPVAAARKSRLEGGTRVPDSSTFERFFCLLKGSLRAFRSVPEAQTRARLLKDFCMGWLHRTRRPHIRPRETFRQADR